MTDKLREAAQQALEALKQAKDAVSDWGLYASEYFQQKHDLQGDLDAIQAQITAITAALAEQPAEQEPVAWLYTLEYGSSIAWRILSLGQMRYPFGVCGADYLRANKDGVSYVRETPLYTAPQPAKTAEHERATRLAQQSAGTHPAPCAGSCEAAAFRAEIRSLHAKNGALRDELKRDRAQEPEVIKAAWHAGYTEGEKAAWAESDALLRQLFDALVLADCRLEGTCLPIKEVDDAISAGRERLGLSE